MDKYFLLLTTVLFFSYMAKAQKPNERKQYLDCIAEWNDSSLVITMIRKGLFYGRNFEGGIFNPVF